MKRMEEKPLKPYKTFKRRAFQNSFAKSHIVCKFRYTPLIKWLQILQTFRQFCYSFRFETKLERKNINTALRCDIFAIIRNSKVFRLMINVWEKSGIERIVHLQGAGSTIFSFYTSWFFSCVAKISYLDF